MTHLNCTYVITFDTQHMYIVHCTCYRIARNFQGLKFSQIALRQIFRNIIFEDVAYVRMVCPAHLTDYTRD